MGAAVTAMSRPAFAVTLLSGWSDVVLGYVNLGLLLRGGSYTSFGAGGGSGLHTWANGQSYVRSAAVSGNNHLAILRAWCLGHLMLVAPSRGVSLGGCAFRSLSVGGLWVSSPVALSRVRRTDAGLASLVLSACGTRLLAALSRWVLVRFVSLVGQYAGTRLAAALAPLTYSSS